MAPIPGIPGGTEPSFQTGQRGWMGLDDLVREVVAWLDRDGLELSPYAVKATVQVMRREIEAHEGGELPPLLGRIHGLLRSEGVILQPGQVERILRVYASIVALLDVRDVHELDV